MGLLKVHTVARDILKLIRSVDDLMRLYFLIVHLHCWVAVSTPLHHRRTRRILPDLGIVVSASMKTASRNAFKLSIIDMDGLFGTLREYKISNILGGKKKLGTFGVRICISIGK